MALYVVLYHHRHGVTPCVMVQDKEPSQDQMAAALEDIGEDTSELGKRDDEYVEAILVSPQSAPGLNEGVCDGPECPGWAVFNDHEIQRCDTCERFRSDEEAVAYVKALEAVDVGRHLDAASHRALDEIRNELSAVVVEAASNPKVDAKKLVERLEVLLGRSVWLERHRWSEHGLQFARLLSELYSIGEAVEDTETIDPKLNGYFLVKIAELEQSMNLPWPEILSLFERADSVFQGDKPSIKETKG